MSLVQVQAARLTRRVRLAAPSSLGARVEIRRDRPLFPLLLYRGLKGEHWRPLTFVYLLFLHDA